MNMRIVITGGTGFVGKWLVKEIAQHHNEVILLTIDENDKPIEFNHLVNIKYVVCPLDKLETIDSNEISDKQVDVFMHLAWVGTSGVTRSDEDIQINNVKYACAAVKLAKKLGVRRFINAGSIMEYEAFYTLSSNRAVPSTMMYSVAKLSQDFFSKTLCNKLEMEYINIVIGNIYGVGEKSQRFINVMAKKMMKNERVELTECMQKYDFIYASDAARAVYLVIEKGVNNNSYYIGNSEPTILKEYVLEMKRILNSNSEIVFGAVPFTNVALSYQEFDMAKLKRELGFIPETSFEKGITMMKEWLLNEEF